MKGNKAFIGMVSLLVAICGGFVPAWCAPAPAGTQAQEQTAAGQNAIAKSIGAIKAISGNAITLAPASGPEIAVTVQPNARLLRLAPGDKDLKNATPLQLQDLQVGDTIRVRGLASSDGKAIAALEIIVITRSAVEAVSDQIRQDWQKRGMGGLVSAVDPAAGTVSISITGFSGTRTIVVHISKGTVIRRYTPDSVKFEDARPSTLDAVKPGDQLRARGERSADGTEFAADEIVTGSFRNIAGTVNSVDASAGMISVQDLLSKKTVQVRVTADSQLHKLPAEMAQRIAMRLKGAMPPGAPGAATAPTSAASQSQPPNGQTTASIPGGPGGGMGLGARSATRSGGADFQQMLSRMPAVALADLHKGDAVMLVTTQGTASSAGTTIMLLAGVEPILEAAPSASQAMLLTPWSLGGAPGGDFGSQ